MSTITVKRWHDNLLQGLGRGPDRHVFARMAAEFRCMGRTNAFSSAEWIPRGRARPRGHGRSSQASSGNDMNGYAEDLSAVIETLDLKDATLVGHSTGGGEVARYIGRHGTKRPTGDLDHRQGKFDPA
jgi:pimeloyl-ACP methyl ester carboxylesterase